MVKYITCHIFFCIFFVLSFGCLLFILFVFFAQHFLFISNFCMFKCSCQNCCSLRLSLQFDGKHGLCVFIRSYYKYCWRRTQVTPPPFFCIYLPPLLLMMKCYLLIRFDVYVSGYYMSLLISWQELIMKSLEARTLLCLCILNNLFFCCQCILFKSFCIRFIIFHYFANVYFNSILGNDLIWFISSKLMIIIFLILFYCFFWFIMFFVFFVICFYVQYMNILWFFCSFLIFKIFYILGFLPLGSF